MKKYKTHGKPTIDPPPPPDPITEIKCPQCGKMTGEVDVCPFSVEIEGDDAECECCPSCRHQCAMEI